VVFAAQAAVAAIECRCLRGGLLGFISHLTGVVALALRERVAVVMVVAAGPGVIVTACPGRWAAPGGMEPGGRGTWPGQ